MKEIYLKYKAKVKKVNYLTVLEKQFVYWRKPSNELDTHTHEREM
jgi:hypothetical protein